MEIVRIQYGEYERHGSGEPSMISLESTVEGSWVWAL